jgi:hypothetical protein
MTFQELQTLIAAMQKTHAWLFEKKRDTPLTAERLREIEKAKNISLDADYRDFLMSYGAGEFAYADIYSPDPNSPWSSWSALETCHVKPRQFIPVADNGGGDYLGFCFSDGKPLRPLFWANHECDYETSESEYGSFVEFIAKWALRIGETEDAEQGGSPYSSPAAGSESGEA